VLGYELFNEPFPGSAWPACANAVGCPFDAELTALYRRTDAAIRAVDRRTVVWYEPNVLFNAGFGSEVGALDDPGGGFAFARPTSRRCPLCVSRVVAMIASVRRSCRFRQAMSGNSATPGKRGCPGRLETLLAGV
jgi:hypothetical protein